MKRLSLLSAALLLASCSKNIQTTEAVRQGVMDYMNTIAPKIGLDLTAMTVDVPAVTFDHDHARATVTVKPKTVNTAGMELVYNLDRQGDKWVVHGNAESAGSSHGTPEGGAGGEAPGAGPGPLPPGAQLPPGHPGVAPGQGGGGLPPGHPATGTDSSGTKP